VTALSDLVGAPGVVSLCDALVRTSARLALLMRHVPDPMVPAVGAWSIGETALHVCTWPPYFLDAARGRGRLESHDDVAAVNARAIAADPERDPGRLAGRLEAGVAALTRFARTAVDDPAVDSFRGVRVPLSTLLSLELGELLVHGYDIARGAGLEWRIDPVAARLTLQGYLPMLPYALDRVRARGVHLAVALTVRGLQPVCLCVANERLTVDGARRRRVDAHLSAAPAAYLLLTWRRVPLWQPVVRGQLLVWGRRPWRVAELPRLIAT
jgi:hypothetical protein